MIPSLFFRILGPSSPLGFSGRRAFFGARRGGEGCPGGGDGVDLVGLSLSGTGSTLGRAHVQTAIPFRLGCAGAVGPV